MRAINQTLVTIASLESPAPLQELERKHSTASNLCLEISKGKHVYNVVGTFKIPQTNLAYVFLRCPNRVTRN